MSATRANAPTSAASTLTGEPGRPSGLGLEQVGLEEDVPRRRGSGGGNQHVARAGGEVVGYVEPGRAPQHARHALLEEQTLDELGLGLVAPAGHAHEIALRVLPLDLARALVGRRDGRLDPWAPA